MSNIDNEEKNDEQVNDEGLISEEEAVTNILSYKTARYLVVFLLVVAILAFVISYIDFKKQADQGLHVKYFFMELNIPKGYPDTVYVSKMVYLDTNKIVHDTLYIDKKGNMTTQPPAMK
ncbi:MAG: hypothetical protein JWQ38_1460 [Flavipsychrobacter sp.]|nr:hypothetical protein [Flavipsychrobacter sp.]